MAEYDGSIRINTEIEAKNAEKELKSLKGRITKTASEISRLQKEILDAQVPTEQYISLQNAINASELALKDFISKQKQLSEKGIGKGIDKEYLVAYAAVKRLKNELQQAIEAGDKDTYLEIEDKLNRAKSVLQELMSKEPRPLGDISYYYAIDEKINRLKNDISATESEMKQLEESGKAFSLGEGTEEKAVRLKELTEQMTADTERQTELQSALAEREEHLAEIRENAVVGNQRIIETVERIKELEQEIADLKAAGITEGYEDYDSRIQELERLKQEVKDYANGTNEMQDSYKRLGQALTDLNGKLSSILRPIQKIQSAFAQDVKVSGYEKLQSSLGELGGIAIRAAETVKNTFATLKQGKQGVVAVIHSLSSSLLNMANTVNSAIGSVLGNGLEKLGEGIGAVVEKIKIMASGIGSAISSAAKVVLEKLAGLVGSGLNLILHPFQTLKNVATTTLGGIANIIKGVLGSALEGLKKRAAGLAASIINGIVHPFQTLKKIGGSAVKGVTKLFSGMITVVKKAGKAISSIASILKRATSSMLGFGKSTKSSNNPLQAGFKNILKYGLGIRSLYALINKLRTAIKEGFTNMANEVDGFKAKVDSLQGSTLTLKNSFAAAFRPLVEVAIPYIQMVADALSNLLDMVGQFTAAITGQKSYTKAIKQTTAAIEDENAAQNKQLSGLDKLNNLSSGSGGSADSGASTQMFEENVPISDKFADIAQWIKDMWEKADFTELGTLLGEKLKNALDSIDWEPIKKVAEKIGKSIGTLINGFVEMKGLGESIGKSIGEAINTGISGINAFLDNTHWDSVGKFIGEGLNGLVNSVDFSSIGHYFAQKWNAVFAVVGEAARTFDWAKFGKELASGINTAISDFDWAENGARLGDLVKGILDTIISLLENTNWQELGNNVAAFIGSIDWTGIFERLSEGIGAALGGLTAFLWGLIEDAWKSVVEWWEWTAFEDGKFSMMGLLDGIWEVIKDIGTWIYEHIFQPFIDGFKNAFGIHSPSTVMAEMGIYIMQGLLNGIKSLVSTVVGAIQDVWNGIKKVFEGFITFLTGVFTGDWGKAWGGIVKIFSGVGDAIKGIVNGILGIIESLANGVISGINFVIGALNKLSFTIPATPWTDPIDIGFNIPELSQISIPRLATGTVVPPNNEFLAVLGDNKREPEVVSPISTIEEAVENVLKRNGGMGGGEVTIKIPVEIDGRVLFELMKKFDLEQYKRTGRPSFQM